MDGDLIDDFEFFCFDKEIEKYLGVHIPENTENVNIKAIEILALFMIRVSEIQQTQRWALFTIFCAKRSTGKKSAQRYYPRETNSKLSHKRANWMIA